MKELVFIHGRSQQNKDSVALKAEWIDAFRAGLAKSGLALPIEESSIHFPYYGDTLAGLVDGLPPDKVAEIIVRGEVPRAGVERGAPVGLSLGEMEFQLQYLHEISQAAGLDQAQTAEIAARGLIQRGPLNWGWVRAILSGLDTHVPYASGASVALFTRDVYEYLMKTNVRTQIDEGVRKAIGNKPMVVVAHSLGTVVAYNVLVNQKYSRNWQVPELVTLGCPLAVSVIRDKVAPRKLPDCVGHWYNAMDSRDIVALYPLDERHHWDIDPAIENKTDVDNPTENRHGISGYLGDPVVAKRIYEALQ